MLHVVLCTGIIFTKFDVGQRIRSWLTTFHHWYLTLRCALDLWPFNLERLWCIGRRFSQALQQIWAKSNNPQLSY